MKKIALAVVLACNSGWLMAEEVLGNEVEMDTLEVVAGDVPSYVVKKAVSATKTDTEIHDAPVAIQVVPRTVMDDQQVINVKQAARNVSSVMPSSYQFYEGYIIRGFDTGSNVYRNGLRQPSFTDQQTANVEQVEILKGPAAVLYGRIEPGGLVNVVTKKPLAVPYYSIQQQAGSWDFYRTTVDATGAITNDNTLLYRVNAAYQNNHAFVDYLDNENFFIAPSLTWRPSDKLEFNLDLEFQRKEYVHFGTNGGGVPAIGDRPADLPRSRYIGNPSISVRHPNEQDRNYLGFDWSYAFNDNWSLKHRIGYTDVDYLTHYAGARAFNETTGVLTQSLQGAFQNRRSLGTNLDLTGKFQTGVIQHNVLLGMDYFRLKQYYHGLGLGSAVVSIAPINVFDPVYTDISSVVDTTPENSFFVRKEFWRGFYFQDQMKFGNKWHLLLGGRFDDANHGTGNDSVVGSSITRAWNKLAMRHDNAFSPRIGVLYQPIPAISLYGNYVESFGTNNGISAATGESFDPQKARQNELGVKAEMFGGKLTTTLAAYEITKTNILTRDPNNPTVSIPIGEAQSRGIEFDVAGKIGDHWNIIGNMALTSTEVTKDNSTINIQGNRLAGVPLRSGSIWTTYDGTSGNKGWSYGAGVFLVDQREGDSRNTFQLPGYARVDAFMSYKFQAFGAKTATAQLNVNNLLDKKYFDHGGSNNSRLNSYYGEPLNIMGSLRLEY